MSPPPPSSSRKSSTRSSRVDRDNDDSDGFIGWESTGTRTDNDGTAFTADVTGSGTGTATGNNNNSSSSKMTAHSHSHHENSESNMNTNKNINNDYNQHLDDNSYHDYNSVDFVSDGSSSSSTNDRWSLSVRLNSAVDLPSSIIPSMPLCPLMKFGLITVTAEDEIIDLERSSAKFRRAEFEQEELKDAGMYGQTHGNSGASNNGTGASGATITTTGTTVAESGNNPFKRQVSLRMMTSKGTLAHFQNNAPLEECVAAASNLDNDHHAVSSTTSPSPSDPISPSDPPKIQLTSGKIMSKKDNGMMEWHEEMRWDDVEMPLQTVLCVELSARAVFPPSFINAMDSLSNDAYNNMYNSSNANTNNDSNNVNGENGNSNGNGGILGFWRKGRNNNKGRRGNTPSGPGSIASSYHGSDEGVDYTDDNLKEMEKAAAAATVARYLMEYKSKSDLEVEAQAAAESTIENGGDGNQDYDSKNENDNTDRGPTHQDGDIRLGTLLIPISNLPLEDEVPTVERWFQFDSVTAGNKAHYDGDLSPSSKVPSLRAPSVLLQISLSNPDTLDELEEEAYMTLGAEGEVADDSTVVDEEMRLSIDLGRDRLASLDQQSFRTRKGTEDTDILKKEEEKRKIAENGPFLEPGIVDHICVVGPKDIGDQINDIGSKGWLDAEPECCVLEQFPPEGYHLANGRQCVLPNKVEWWCFPEGCRIWRGSEPPTHMDMNLKRFSASSPPTMASSIAAFDACLDCTSSFMWWVMSSNSDEYGSKAQKIYGAVIRFYVPVPSREKSSPDGSDSKEDDLAIDRKKLWCPIGICLTTTLPIVGTLEALLLRLCEKFSTSITPNNFSDKIIHKEVMNLILNYQSPMPGVINCSIPFISGDGDRLLISLPPSFGLPPLPHGASVTSVCRLLGAEGLTALLAAVLTECKILIHSADVANLAMVAEVITALIYPFRYQLPFIPVIPLSLMEIIEAPVSYFIGVPSCNMKWIDKAVLADIVVIDLDNGFSTPDYFDGRRSAPSSRSTTPLPASVCGNISKSLFRLVRDEQEVEEQFGASNFSGTRHLPRLDSESLAERNFRIEVAQQICSLIRGYQECLFFVSANQPVFNRDRFLRQAPALFEERGRTTNSPHVSLSEPRTQRILSPRSKRFLSGLVNTQHFHDLLERLDGEETSFFHQIMDSLQSETQAHVYGSQQQIEMAAEMSKSLEEMEHKIPTFHVHRDGNRRMGITSGSSSYEDEDIYQVDDDAYMTSFTSLILKKAEVKPNSSRRQQKSLRELMELEKVPWEYCNLFNIKLTAQGGKDSIDTKPMQSTIWPKIQLKEAMGDRKFRAWKDQQAEKDFGTDDVVKGSQKVIDSRSKKSELDLMKLIPDVGEGDSLSSFGSRVKVSGDAVENERDIVRRYIETSYEIVHMNEDDENDKKKEKTVAAFHEFIKNGTSTEVEVALRKPSAQRFLVSVLSQRSRLQDERRQMNPDFNNDASVSHLQPIVFECLVRLCNAMLEACIRNYDYESAYRLLMQTTGFCTMGNDDKGNSRSEMSNVIFMTKRVGMHAIYSDLRLWERVLLLHQQDRQKDRATTGMESDEYEATVSTLYEMLGYGMPADDLARFASRIAAEKFFSTDNEQKILVLARKLALKCDDIDANRDAMLLKGKRHGSDNGISPKTVSSDNGTKAQWEEVNWSHPLNTVSSSESSRNGNMEDYNGQSPITALASFGSSVVASGALDGSVFIAHTFNLDNDEKWASSRSSIKHLAGARLEWQKHSNGSSQGNADDNIGAISCLAASKGANYSTRPNAFSLDDVSDNEAIMGAVAGCRVVGGTTGGDIRVWSVQDVFVNEFFQDLEDVSSMMSESYASSHTSHVRSRAGHDQKLLKEIKRGRSLGCHRGGVTCMSIPTQIYRPDSLISGGNDGLIKQWTLRQDPPGESRRNSMGGRTSRMLFSGRENSSKRIGQEPANVLAGHGGRILCLETAWHGDRLLSGATDFTMKLWDLSSSSGQCIQTMHGHTGWVTKTCFWGRNTAISASTDRSIALWDARAGSAPVFVLRHHQSPVSDLYIESRNAFWMTSAGAEGTVATWDFRKLGCLNRGTDILSSSTNTQTGSIYTQTVRQPIATMKHSQILQSGAECAGPVMLAKGVGTKYGQGDRSVMSVGTDGFINEWDVLSGRLLNTHNTAHGNKVSCFKTFNENDNLLKGRRGRKSNLFCHFGGTITAAWDGKIRLRRMVSNKGSVK